jgi:hypothetical protein
MCFDAHPEWFFRQANGEPVIYNGLYSTCINGGYYREQAMKILAEGLDKYDVDGLFSQCVRQSGARLQRQVRGVVPLRRVQSEIPGGVSQRDSAEVDGRLSQVHVHLFARKWLPRSAS